MWSSSTAVPALTIRGTTVESTSSIVAARNRADSLSQVTSSMPGRVASQAASIGADVLIATLSPAEAELVQQRIGLCPGAEERGEQHDRLARRHPVWQRGGLERRAYPPLHVATRSASVDAVDADAARVRLTQAEDAFEGGRLAGAVW